MIIVKLRGGLGNQLFQYALGKHLALLNQTELKFDISLLGTRSAWTPRPYQLGAFCIDASFATVEEVKTLKGSGGVLSRFFRLFSSHYYKEPHFQFDSKVMELRGGHLYLDGYWQSEKYFAEISSLIRADLLTNAALSDSAKPLFEKIKMTNAVSLHVRRGDYLTRSKANRHLQPCSLDYYQKAINYIAQKIQSPTFFIFSDDMPWVKENLKPLFQTYYVEGNTAQEDLWLMAACRHHIIANSTFSWWGAWLNPNPNKTVIAPQRWFATERLNTQDLLPAEWIQL